MAVKTNTAFGCNAATGTISATTFVGALTGTASGNIANTLMSAKGDLIVSSAANTPARVAHPGAANYILYSNATDTLAYLLATNIIAFNALANGAGALTNDGAGAFSYVAYQASDADLTTYAGITPSAIGQSILAAESAAAGLTILGGQTLNSALTSLSSKVFSKTALTGVGGLDTVLYADISDGDIGYVGTIAGIWYVYVFEDSSAAAESSPSVITPDDAGANNGRWLLKLYCDGATCTVPQAATGAYSTLLEGSGNGTNFRKTSSPDALTADLNLRHANAVPTASQIQVFPAPTDGVAAYTWKDYGERLGATFDGGGSAIALNKITYLHVPFAITAIESWTVVCDQDSGASGIVITPYMDAYAADTLPTTTMCTTGTAPHTTDGAGAGGSVHQAAWDCNITAIPADSIIAFKVTTAPTAATNCSVTLKALR
jgi:hypothetical protein